MLAVFLVLSGVVPLLVPLSVAPASLPVLVPPPPAATGAGVVPQAKDKAATDRAARRW
jgi:hypothetical protein